MATFQKVVSYEKKILSFSLAEHEAAMNESMQNTYVELACHIATVHAGEKYKESYDSIEDWAEDAFGWSRQRIYEFLKTYKVLDTMRSQKFKHLPANESHARALASLDVDDLRDIWTKVEEDIEAGERITASYLKSEIAKLKKEQKTGALAEDAEVLEGFENLPDDDGDVEETTKSTGEKPEIVDAHKKKPDQTQVYEAPDQEHLQMAEILVKNLKRKGFDDNNVRDIAVLMIQILDQQPF